VQLATGSAIYLYRKITANLASTLHCSIIKLLTNCVQCVFLQEGIHKPPISISWSPCVLRNRFDNFCCT